MTNPSSRATGRTTGSDRLGDRENKMTDRELLELVYDHDELAELDPAGRRLALRDVLSRAAPEVDLCEALPRLADEIDGFGPLTPLMEDSGVCDVFVNGPREVWFERDGNLHRADEAFEDAERLMRLLRRLLGAAGRRVDLAHPIADARLPDGSRLHVVLPPIAPAGPLVSIRRHRARGFTLDELTEAGSMSSRDRDAMSDYVRERASIVIAGGTGSGKTTLLNALLGEVGPSERVVTVEETPELRPSCRHAVSLVARSANPDGAGAIDLSQLVRAALRMRPDRIVIGEVRGPEALDALGAMDTGHPGSMMTIHARSADEVLDRLLTLALAGEGAPTQHVLERTARSALDVVVHLDRSADGKRRVTSIVETAWRRRQGSEPGSVEESWSI